LLGPDCQSRACQQNRPENQLHNTERLAEEGVGDGEDDEWLGQDDERRDRGSDSSKCRIVQHMGKSDA